MVRKKKIVAMAGSTGMIGSAVLGSLKDYEILRVTREHFEMSEMQFVRQFEKADILMNFAGEPIIKRWTKAGKRRMLDSRLKTTSGMGRIAEKGIRKKRLFINASAIGIYDDHHLHDEKSSKFGSGFLTELVGLWEQEALRFRSPRTRICLLRLGIVLSIEGGLVRKLKFPFRCGLGAVMDDGKQPFSFIHIDDVKGIVKHLIENRDEEGIFNVVAPDRKNYGEFARIFAGVMNRKARLKIPGFVLHAFFGEGASAITGGQAVRPERLLKSGYSFRYPGLEEALDAIVN